jgi:hypothetical protein
MVPTVTKQCHKQQGEIMEHKNLNIEMEMDNGMLAILT